MRQHLDSEGFGLVGKRLATRDSLGQQRLVMVKVKKVKKKRDGLGRDREAASSFWKYSYSDVR
jgi:hypothetical protein